MYYILDTNIWIDVAQGKLACSDVAGRASVAAVLAPPVIVELVRGVVKGGERYFLQNRSMVECIAVCRILEMPKDLAFRILWHVAAGAPYVRPEHFRTLLDLLRSSTSLSIFVSAAKRLGGLWEDIGKLDSVHEGFLRRELPALDTLADRASIKTLHMFMVNFYRLGGLLPDPDAFDSTFSAAMEFLRSSILQVRSGANLLKNNRGVYIDNQLFFYLADPEAVIVSNEDFSAEIRISPQKSRIISYAAFCRL